jgi:pSer/pThr/pTyr-binding forkhead associated (FHA) protein
MARPHIRRRSDPPHGGLPRVTVEITRGRARVTIREVHVSAYLIGGAEDCDLILADPRFPDVHAYILRHHDGVTLRYLGSKPALTVNNRLMRTTELFDGDCIATGPYEFTIHIESSGSRVGPRRPAYLRMSTDRRRTVSANASAKGEVEAVRLLRTVRAMLSNAKGSVRVFREVDTNVAG